MAKSTTKNLRAIISRPRITEKATMLATRELPVYTFEVAPRATKSMVASAVKDFYKVTPVKIRICNIPRKSVTTRQGVGMKKAVRKALVTLKKGEKLEFV